MKKYIYGLTDNGVIFYVGLTINPLQRFEHHKFTSKELKNEKDKRIQEIITSNRVLSYHILYECSEIENANIKERETVISLRNNGIHLLNGHIPTAKESIIPDVSDLNDSVVIRINSQMKAQLKQLAIKDNRKLVDFCRLYLSSLLTNAT